MRHLVHVLPAPARALLQEGGADFLAVAVSPWHAVGIDAALLSTQALSGKPSRGLIFIVPHSRDGFLITDEAFLVARATKDIHIARVEPTQGGVRRWFSTLADDRRLLRRLKGGNASLASSAKSVDLLSPMRPSLPLARLLLEMPDRPRPCFVTYDEGIGLYLSEKIWKTVQRLDGEAPSAPAGLRRRYRNALRARIEELAAKKSRWLFSSDPETGALRLEEGVGHAYREVFRAWASSVPRERWLPKTPAAMIVTQPVSELEQLPLENEMRVMERIIRMLSDLGFAPLIKSHPRERAGKYEDLARETPMRLLAEEVSAEAYFAGLRNGDIVVGLTSTALLTASSLFEVPTYSLASLFLEEPQLGSLFRDAHDDFTRVCRHYVKSGRPEFAAP